MNTPKEGQLYKRITVDGHTFDICYGYYSDAERGRWPPTPIFPDFTKEPLLSPTGRRFVTGSQDICLHYKAKPTVSGEEWCGDCVHFIPGEDIIGICGRSN